MPIFDFDESPVRDTITDVYKVLLKNRKVWLAGDVDETSIYQVCTELQALDIDSHEPIELFINSPGGCVASGLGLIDLMDHIKSPVHTIAMGDAMSMGAYILAAGEPGHRYASRSSRIMIHQISSSSCGETDDMEISVEETKRCQEYLLKLFAKQCGKSYRKVKRDVKKDYFMSAKAATKYGDKGLIDKILK